MKVLYLAREVRAASRRSMLDELGKHVELTIEREPKSKLGDLQAALDKYEAHTYDRILLDWKWTFTKHQPLTVAATKNLVIFETDIWQNFFKPARNYGKFAAFFKHQKGLRLITTGWHHAEKLRQLGVDCTYVSKSYEPDFLFNENRERDIAFGFIGSIHRTIDFERSKLLNWAEAEHDVRVFRTERGNAYREGLNRVNVFVSADIGMNEYMFKNFEAMACGCALLAYRQGGEAENIGFIDGENVLLYGNKEEFSEKVAFCKANPELVREIAARGQKHAEDHLSGPAVARKIVAAMEPPLRNTPMSLASKIATLRFQRPFM